MDFPWLQKFNALVATIEGKIEFPSWLGNEEFHRSHRSNLLRKNFEFYNKYFDEQPNLPYIWAEEKK